MPKKVFIRRLLIYRLSGFGTELLMASFHSLCLYTFVATASNPTSDLYFPTTYPTINTQIQISFFSHCLSVRYRISSTHYTIELLCRRIGKASLDRLAL
jgi:hypothetical protein